jgi:ketosteroid isomerase-like protein
VASDAQGIDEISRRWIRGSGELVAFVQELLNSVEDVHSEMHDAHESVWGDTGLVTLWLEQDYAMQGERVHVSAPTSVVLRREEGEWRVVLWHSLPLEPEDSIP